MKLIAGLIFMLIAASAATFFITGLESDAPDEQAGTSPLDEAYDYYAENMRTTRFAADGGSVSQLRAERVTHFPDDDRAELVAPNFTSFGSGAWQVSARAGTLVPDPQRGDDRLDLSGDVELRKPRADGDYEISTSALTVYANSEEAYNDVPVEFRMRGSRHNGTGLQARLAENYIHLDKGTGTHEPASRP